MHIYWSKQPRVFRRLTSLLFLPSGRWQFKVPDGSWQNVNDEIPGYPEALTKENNLYVYALIRECTHYPFSDNCLNGVNIPWLEHNNLTGPITALLLKPEVRMRFMPNNKWVFIFEILGLKCALSQTSILHCCSISHKYALGLLFVAFCFDQITVYLPVFFKIISLVPGQSAITIAPMLEKQSCRTLVNGSHKFTRNS